MPGMSAALPNAVPPPTPEPRYHPLVVVLIAAAGGHLARSVLAAALVGVVDRGGGRLGPVALRLPAGSRSTLAGFALLMAVAATAGAWHHCRWYLAADDELGRFARRKAEPVCVEAVVARMPRPLPTPASDPLRMMPATEGCRIEVDLLAVRDGSCWRGASGRTTIQVYGPPPEVRAGDRVRCFAHLSAPQGPQNPGAFDYAAQLRANGVYSRLAAKVPQCISVVRPGGWLSVAGLLDQVRAQGNRLLETYLDPRCAEMAEAVLLGQREEVDSGRTENFMATGTIHLLVIAGLHLGILAGALFWVLRRTPLPRGWVAGAGCGRHALLHAPGRCRAAGGAGHGVGVGGLCRRILGPTPAFLQLAGRRGTGGFGHQSEPPFPHGAHNSRSSRWPG